ncbi:MAG: Polysulfide reductase, NrfD [Acidobacteria bacterium]|jgi:Ni/Fe-hydrogenase subunit HybB-like protein|nr:Polysulfide reductase, NrfD [Acidobacteriota bacterium]
MLGRDGFRLPLWRGIFYLLLAIGLPLVVLRYTQGLGAVTNLTDEFPWGLWIGFDLLCGVGLAAGGFTVTAAVYIFNLKRFHPIIRPTVLTAFLGYLLVIMALLVDLGRPWNIWHPIIMWNPRSVMFEVGWCVMLYTTVLALELSGMVFERVGWKRAVSIQKAATIPLVLAGVLLSTLHQSSLGALYLIVPNKLHPLWYSPALPWIFWTSAIAAGLAMVIVESRLSSRAFGRPVEMHLLKDIARALLVALGVFAVLRTYDLVHRGVIAEVFRPSYESGMFALEFALGVLLPFVLLLSPRTRTDIRRLYPAALLAVSGFLVNRLNVSVTGLERSSGTDYVPAFSEIAISLFLVALGFGAFGLMVRYFRVYPEAAARSAAAPRAPAKPSRALAPSAGRPA